MYLQNNNILYKYQFGFRADHSTNHALTEITEQIKKALGTVNQNIFLAQLKHCGIKCTRFDWFKSSISDMVQYTSIDLKEL